jgi:uroporphyrinogen decarboxylase
MTGLTQYQIFKNSVNHINTGRFLYYARFTPHLDKKLRKDLNIGVEVSLYEHFHMYNPVELSLDDTQYFNKENYMSYYSDVEKPEGSVINEIGVLQIPGSMYHFTKTISPLRDAVTFEDIKKFPYVDLKEMYTDGLAHMKAKAESAHENGRVASCWLGHMYENAWAVRGYEQFLMDMMLNKEWCEFILDKFMNFNLTKAEAAAKAGADIIRTGDDVANQRSLMFSPGQWREMMKPRWAEVFYKARSIKPDIQIWYHSDGNIEEIIPDLIEIGVTILNPVQPECMNVVSLKKRFGDRLVFDGTIGTQSVMPFGSPDDVKRTVRQYCETLGYDGALILSPTHVLEPEVPIENIVAFFEEVGRNNTKQ